MKMKRKPGSRLLALILVLAMLVSVLPVTASAEEMTDLILPNGDFEEGTKNWSLTGWSEVTSDSWAKNNTTNTLKLWLSDDEAAYGSASYTVTLTAGQYVVFFDISGASGASGLAAKVTGADGQTLSEFSETATTGWDVWATCSFDFDLSEETEVTFTLSGTIPKGYWGFLDNVYIRGTGSIVVKDPDPVEAPIYVPYIKGTDGEFMRGMDVSSVLSILNSGAKFYDYDGSELDGQGFFNLLAASGTNWIRLRVWNNPFDAEGNGYGGGNCDVTAAVTMGKWATEAGMKVLIDFHYSDFWADPGKQQVPKAWKGYTVDEKAAAIEEYTYKSLKTLLDAGVDVGMVQVGNETTNSICGESTWANRATLFSAGSKAVRTIAAEYNRDILVAIHFTNPERSGNYANFAKQLDTYKVDYDVFASSWYPYWHGTLNNLTTVLKQVADTYGKKVIVAETSWAYTLEDGDGHANTVRSGSNDSGSYPFSAQGQALLLSDVAQAVKNVGEAGVGMFYWESAWIPVRNVSQLTGDEYTAQVEENKKLWEQYGSGWASSFAGEYDSKDAGVWYGGSAVDNQALFDFDGHPLDSLKIYAYMQAGTTGAEITIEAVTDPKLSFTVGDTLVLPETVSAINSLGQTVTVAVTWNAEDVSAVDMQTPGLYTVNGTVEGGITVTCSITVNYPNLLLNPSFELSDMSMYTISATAKRTTDDPKTGSYSLHYYSSGTVDFTVEQRVTLKPGTYDFSLFSQGGNVGENASTYIYVKYGDTELTQDFAVTGWCIWDNPTLTFTVKEETAVTVGANITASQTGGWGTLDDWYLCKSLTHVHIQERRNAAEATCTEDGYTGDLYCLDCGELLEKGSVISALGHGYTDTVVAPTCEQDGYTEHTCSRCGYNYRDQFSDALGHDYASVVTDPTCAGQGYTTHTCTRCGDSYVDGYADPTGHTMGEWTTGKAPTCTETGIKTRTCQDCGEKEAEILPALGHTYTAAVTEPTCETIGYTTHTCETCGHSYVDSMKPALGHDYQGVVTAPTHEKMGYTTYTCTRCDHSYIGDYVDAPGHTYVAAVTKEPTCTEEGVMTFTCDCGETYTQSIPKVDHTYEATVTKPDCTHMGYTTHTCTVCSHSFRDSFVDATGHNYTDTVIPATCTEYGYTNHVCTVCSHSYISDLVQPQGHKGELRNVKQAACTEAGYTGDLICAVCGEKLAEGETIQPTGHDWGEWVTVKKPTCTVAGEEIHTCGVCGGTETREIAPIACPSKDYKDVGTANWYHDAVDYMILNGCMNGIGGGLFGTFEDMSRAQLITILYRIAGMPGVEGLTHPFRDVAEGVWYSDAITWAYNEGIVNGVEADLFAPDDSVTRQQMVAILFRFAGGEAVEEDCLSDFVDGGQVQSYAKDAMNWAVSTGLIRGDVVNGSVVLVPDAMASRAQGAIILTRFLQNIYNK
ncbi:MAG: glycosyl hydrolase 53 family protein [Faecousia sp.]